MSLLDDYIKREYGEPSLGDSLFGLFPTASPTSYFRSILPSGPISTETILKPPVYKKILIGFGALILFTMACFLICFAIISQDVGVLIAFLVTVVLLIQYIRRGFISKEFNYRITLNDRYIAIDDRQYLWDELTETAIMTGPQERGKRDKFLVLFSTNAVAEKYNLAQLSISPEKLAGLIEYYKEK